MRIQGPVPQEMMSLKYSNIRDFEGVYWYRKYEEPGEIYKRPRRKFTGSYKTPQESSIHLPFLYSSQRTFSHNLHNLTCVNTETYP